MRPLLAVTLAMTTIACSTSQRPPVRTAAEEAAAPAPSPAPTPEPERLEFSFKAHNGDLQILAGEAVALDEVRLRLRLPSGPVNGKLEPAGETQGRDEAGAFAASRFSFAPEKGAPQGLSATLELRRYEKSGALVALLDYQGPALAPVDGIALLLKPADFARGMAAARMKLHWTIPAFVSDYRILAAPSQLLLWRRAAAPGFLLMAPLAGDGMVGELGAADFEFRVGLSARAPDHVPKRVALMTLAAGGDPHRLPRAAYDAAFAAMAPFGKLRWDKPYPEIFRDLGWCSWNTYYDKVDREKVLASVRSFKERKIPVRYVLVDDGWQTLQDRKMSGWDANPSKFPGGLASLVRTLEQEHGIGAVGVWHTLQGYWKGVEPSSEIGKRHPLFQGNPDFTVPQPGEAGAAFWNEWYAQLRGWGIDFVKVDNQSRHAPISEGLAPLYGFGEGTQRNFQSAVDKHLRDAGGAGPVVNCMSQTLENAYSWRSTNVVRNSDDYLPGIRVTNKEHVHQNAYNAYWTASFGWPDWDMFQSHDPDAEYHAMARAVSGGPIYFTDEPGKERPEILQRLALSDGRLLRLDEPGQVTPDLLLRDPAIEPLALKVAGWVTRPGYRAHLVGAFHVNKSLTRVGGWVDRPAGATSAAVYVRSSGRALRLQDTEPAYDFELGDYSSDLFTVVPVERGIAVFGLLDKYVGPAAVIEQRWDGESLVVELSEAGDFGAWLEQAPREVELDGRALSATQFEFQDGLLKIPAEAFPKKAGPRELRLR